MPENKNLENLNEETIVKLSRTVELIDVLDELLDGERKTYTILMYIKENVKIALSNTNACQNMISTNDF